MASNTIMKVTHALIRSPAYRNLSGKAVRLLIDFLVKDQKTKGKEFEFTIRDAAILGYSDGGFRDSVRQLEQNGFVKVTTAKDLGGGKNKYEMSERWRRLESRKNGKMTSTLHSKQLILDGIQKSAEEEEEEKKAKEREKEEARKREMELQIAQAVNGFETLGGMFLRDGDQWRMIGTDENIKMFKKDIHEYGEEGKVRVRQWLTERHNETPIGLYEQDMLL